MTYKHFYIAILFRLIVLVVLGGIATWLFLQKQYWLAGLTALFLVGQIFNIISYFNKINHWISFFLLGIENEDTTLKIPAKTGNKAIDEVYRGLSRLNELFWQTKMQINTQEQYFRSVISQSATGLFSVNEKGRVLNVNPAASNLTNLTDYQHVNSLRSIDEALPEFIIQSSESAEGLSAIFENQFGQKLLFKLSDVSTKNEKIRLVAVSDITKELDTREVDAWIKLARTLSHEIMNNIAPITTLSQVISKKFIKENHRVISVDEIEPKILSDTVKGLGVIEERSQGLMNFVENYRKFTKLPEPNLKETDLSALIKNNLLAAEAFREFGKIKKEITIPEQMPFFTDESLLSQVLTNLLKNATEALFSRYNEKPVLKISLTKTEKKARIEISNNGPEIPPEIREQIFIPFYTTKEEGSGVGLSLSKQIMLKMGGDVVLQTDKNNWTTFVITISELTSYSPMS
ncbi:MAG: GHKL domain-containing protein [Bacteroidales bacterium]|nr:GHKL domain-containing protein [Bacteroidales bacterium]